MSQTMTIDSDYSVAVSRFGTDKGNRIYADALLLQADNGKPLADCMRIVVGSLKKIKTANGVNYDKALDMFDNQMVEGRHYSVESALTREVKRIEAYNKTEKAESEKVALVVQAIKDAQAEQDASPDVVLNARLWVEAFMRDLSPPKRAYMAVVLKRYAAGESFPWKDQDRLRRSYCPKGIGFEAFLEVVYRYS